MVDNIRNVTNNNCNEYPATGVAVVKPGRTDVQVRRSPVERDARRVGGPAGVFAVARHGPEQAAGARQVRGAAGAALAIRRHRAGPGRGGRPGGRVPCGRNGGRIRHSDRQLARSLSPVRLRRHAVRQELRAAIQTVRARNRNQNSGQGGGMVRARCHRRPVRGRHDCVSERRRRQSLLLRRTGPGRLHSPILPRSGKL